MARNVLSPTPASMQGSAVTMSAATVDGDAVPPSSLLLVTNGSGATITLTFITAGTAEDLAVADPTATVPAGATRLFGPIPGGFYPQSSGPTSGLVHVDYSAFASVTRACLAASY